MEIDEFFDQNRHELITETAKDLKSYVDKTWPGFETRLEVSMKDLFPDPGKGGLQTIWKYGSADLVISKKGRIVAILEPGGSHHFNDPNQIRRDKRKWKLCEINGVRCFKFANSLFYALSNRKKRTMLGKVIFGLK
jgi:hypothetical protein